MNALAKTILAAFVMLLFIGSLFAFASAETGIVESTAAENYKSTPLEPQSFWDSISQVFAFISPNTLPVHASFRATYSDGRTDSAGTQVKTYGTQCVVRESIELVACDQPGDVAGNNCQRVFGDFYQKMSTNDNLNVLAECNKLPDGSTDGITSCYERDWYKAAIAGKYIGYNCRQETLVGDVGDVCSSASDCSNACLGKPSTFEPRCQNDGSGGVCFCAEKTGVYTNLCSSDSECGTGLCALTAPGAGICNGAYTDNAYTACSNGDVYNYNSNGLKQTLKQDCGTGTCQATGGTAKCVATVNTTPTTPVNPDVPVAPIINSYVNDVSITGLDLANNRVVWSHGETLYTGLRVKNTGDQTYTVGFEIMVIPRNVSNTIAKNWGFTANNLQSAFNPPFYGEPRQSCGKYHDPACKADGTCEYFITGGTFSIGPNTDSKVYARSDMLFGLVTDYDRANVPVIIPSTGAHFAQGGLSAVDNTQDYVVVAYLYDNCFGTADTTSSWSFVQKGITVNGEASVAPASITGPVIQSVTCDKTQYNSKLVGVTPEECRPLKKSLTAEQLKVFHLDFENFLLYFPGCTAGAGCVKKFLMDDQSPVCTGDAMCSTDGTCVFPSDESRATDREKLVYEIFNDGQKGAPVGDFISTIGNWLLGRDTATATNAGICVQREKTTGDYWKEYTNWFVDTFGVSQGAATILAILAPLLLLVFIVKVTEPKQRGGFQ